MATASILTTNNTHAKTEQCLRDLTTVNNSRAPQSTTRPNKPTRNPNESQLSCSIVFRVSTHLTLLPLCFEVSDNTWRSRRLSGLWEADSCLTIRGEGQPPSPGGTWHVPSNALLCWLRRITILRLARQKVSQPPRHPNSSAGRNPVVLSAPISLLCVHCEGEPRAVQLYWPAVSTKSRQLNSTCALCPPTSSCVFKCRKRFWLRVTYVLFTNQLHHFIPFPANFKRL